MTYEFAMRYPTQSALSAGMAIATWTDSCNELRGRFTVYEISFTVSGALQSFAVDFEQHCEGLDPALHGSLRLNAARTDLIPFAGAYPTNHLRVSVEGSGTVTAPGIDCGVDCEETASGPSIVTLFAAPAAGFVFAGWGEDCTGGATTTVNVNQRRRCTAVFSPRPETPTTPLSVNTLLIDSDPATLVITSAKAGEPFTPADRAVSSSGGRIRAW
jgi:hypothetical protein